MGIEKPGWYSRGYLPHFDVADKVQFITFHLADSIPQSSIDRIEGEIKCLPKERQEMERRRRLEKWLDVGHGSCCLQEPDVASIVENELLRGDGDQYMLLSWTIMPNHVHVAAEFSDVELVWKTVKGWKGASATKSNRVLQRQGTFWFRDYWDRYIRDRAHLRNTLRYIDQNPVKARLCLKPDDWVFGSARLETPPSDSAG